VDPTQVQTVTTWVVVVAWVVFYAGGWAPAGSHPTWAPPPLSCSRPGSGLAIRTDGTEPPPLFVLLLTFVLVSAPVAVFFVPAFVAGRASRSFRSGLQAAVWTVTAMIPLTYAIWLPEGLRRHAIDGRLLVDGGVVAPVGANLADALVSASASFPCSASPSR
jgi:hypothetical protein